MGIDIKQFKHTSKRLWSLIGPLVTDREIHKELGGPIYSSPDCTWFVAIDSGQVVGFAMVREAKTSIWLDYAWTKQSSRGNGVHKKLAAARDEFIATLDEKPIRVCCHEKRWKHYAKRGFVQTSKRGSWVYGIKEK